MRTFADWTVACIATAQAAVANAGTPSTHLIFGPQEPLSVLFEAVENIEMDRKILRLRRAFAPRGIKHYISRSPNHLQDRDESSVGV
ncbi:MAG: hypothetical protein M1829_001334 [Trizodia sp. TS-e1964]|nr:MAG: hypothetical protein M1829_001334 [Trizodia sp. TS-e1964]